MDSKINDTRNFKLSEESEKKSTQSIGTKAKKILVLPKKQSNSDPSKRVPNSLLNTLRVRNSLFKQPDTSRNSCEMNVNTLNASKQVSIVSQIKFTRVLNKN